MTLRSAPDVEMWFPANLSEATARGTLMSHLATARRWVRHPLRCLSDVVCRVRHSFLRPARNIVAYYLVSGLRTPG